MIVKTANAIVATFVFVQILDQINCLGCTDNSRICNNGTCLNGYCYCSRGFANFNNTICNYQQKNKLTAFLLSFFLGPLGADWFYLSHNNGGYIAAGFFKLFISIFGLLVPCTYIVFSKRSNQSEIGDYILLYVGIFFVSIGDTVWWLADWIRILTNTFKDGNGQDLSFW
jgi:hypothetical protein